MLMLDGYHVALMNAKLNLFPHLKEYVIIKIKLDKKVKINSVFTGVS